MSHPDITIAAGHAIHLARAIVAAQDSTDPARWAAVDGLADWVAPRMFSEFIAHLTHEDAHVRASHAVTVAEWGNADGGAFLLLFGTSAAEAWHAWAVPARAHFVA